MNAPHPAPHTRRRQMLAALAALGTVGTPHAATPAPTPAPPPDDAPRHKIVYQLNRAEEAHQEAIFNSISAMLKKYVDDVAIAVVAWGPGIHLLARQPQRPVPPLMQQRARSMAEAYGVRFIACGNTLHGLGWTPADLLDFAAVQDVGAAAVMELQEQGYAYLAW